MILATFKKTVLDHLILVNKTILFLIILITCCFRFVIAQDSKEVLLAKEKQLNSLYGVHKLEVLNGLSRLYQDSNGRKSLRYARQAEMLGTNLYDIDNKEDVNHNIALAFYQIAAINLKKEKYFDFADNLESLKTINESLHDSSITKVILKFEFKLDSLEQIGKLKPNFIKRTLSNIKLGNSIRSQSQQLKINTLLKQAKTKEKNKKYLSAIENYESAINLNKNKGDEKAITELQLKVASLYDSLNMHQKSKSYLENAIKEKEALKKIGSTITFLKIQVDSLSRDSLLVIKDQYQDLAKTFESKAEYQKSLRYYQLYQQITQNLFEDSVQTAAESELRKKEILLLTQQKNIAALNLEKSETEIEKQEQQKKTLYFIGLILLISAILGYSLFLSKRRKHKKLEIAYSELDIANTKLSQAENRITKLLKEQVSTVVADELLSSEKAISGQRCIVSILFLDIRGFTKLAQKLSASELISFQNKAFGPMLDCIQKYEGIVNQLLGDGFMATFGISNSEANHCEQAYLAAIAILNKLRTRIKEKEVEPFDIGIGIHTGEVVIGNVGNTNRKQFSITGNPVIIASRLEQLNKSYGASLIISNTIFNSISKSIRPKNFETDKVNVRGRNDAIEIHIMK
ncbi:adenylate/guanylate cyclase domain-containing protein [Croceitalea sp. P059]|uniref:adenylate/guanylate cyclase domain-containing protein n=1 Tax=Croceitalea sp. P059 TaxID=3075601 RepID=UPI0028839433|nr:adenylate/guanylate cyclase domain-containing protein [Croceitalea sp. P059]MDT0539930.1 adenylate/guanylate cyclase domain-containing protein [Croceitalea sp. P059]